MDRSRDKEMVPRSTSFEEILSMMDLWPGESTPTVDLDEEDDIPTPPVGPQNAKGVSPTDAGDQKAQVVTPQTHDEWSSESTPTLDLDEEQRVGQKA